jgi:hypothetical protein
MLKRLFPLVKLENRRQTLQVCRQCSFCVSPERNSDIRKNILQVRYKSLYKHKNLILFIIVYRSMKK